MRLIVNPRAVVPRYLTEALGDRAGADAGRLVADCIALAGPSHKDMRELFADALDLLLAQARRVALRNFDEAAAQELAERRAPTKA